MSRNGRSLGFDHGVIRLTQCLGLPARGDCLAELRRHALTRIDHIVDQWPEAIVSLESLLQIVAARLSVCIEYIRTDADIARIAAERGAYTSHLAETLRCEFVRGTSEGLLIEHENPQPGDRQYLVVVDARGERAARAYFTTWHEISHVLTTPPQLEFKLFRRTPAAEDVQKDPVESAVDHVAGAIAFYGPIFNPALNCEVHSEGGLTFRAIERARDSVAPSASTYSAAVAAVRSCSVGVSLVRAELRYKPLELRKLRSPQQELGIGQAPEAIVPKLRLVDVVSNEASRNSSLRLHEHIRVPEDSVISHVYREAMDDERFAREDQAAWATSTGGRLPRLNLEISAIRRGTAVYALIAAV